MNRFYKYWWNLKTALRVLLPWSIVFASIGGMTFYVLDVAGAGDVAKNLVFPLVAGAFLWKVFPTFQDDWPPTVEEVKEKKAERGQLFDLVADGSGGSGVLGGYDPASGLYRCGDCGVLLENPGSMSRHNGVYSCASCGHTLDDQILASLFEAKWNDRDG